MTIARYRKVDEMPPVARTTNSAELVRRIRAVWTRARRLAVVSYTPGVQKFTSVEAAHKARQRMQYERVRQMTKHRRG